MTIAYDYKTRTNYTGDAAKQKAAHKVLLEHRFEPSLPVRGYTNRTLHIDLSTLTVSEKTGHRADEGGVRRRPWLRPLVPLERHQADDEVERPGERHHHQPGPAGGEHGLRRVGQVAGGDPLAADRDPDRQQRGRVLRAAAEVLRLRRPRDPGQGREATSSSLIDGPKGEITIEEAPEENPDSHVAAEVFMHQYADDEKDFVNVSVVSAGKGADHSRIGCLNFSWFDPSAGRRG